MPSGTVTCAFSASSVVTLEPVSSDVPRSPRSTPPIQSRYCSGSGWSSPSRSRIASTCSGVLLVPAISWRDVTGKHPQGEEDQHAGDEQPEQEQGQSRQRVADHPLLLASSARLRRSFTLIEGIPVMLVPTATTEAPL